MAEAPDTPAENPDRLIVTGLGKPLDGEYEFDIAGMLTVGHPQSLTSREGHRIKVMSGVRAGELEDALAAGDNDVLVAIGAIVLTRNGKRVVDDRLWDAPMGSLAFDIAARDEQEDEESPPEEAPTTGPSESGGASSSPTSDSPQASDQSPTGPPVSLKPVTSDPETLAS
jgi:hypothetical protein